MNIIDNFLPEDEFDYMERNFLGSYFPWYYNAGISNYPYETDGHNYQLTHLLVLDTGERTHFSSLLDPLIKKINPKKLIRAKVNLGPRDFTQVEGGWHRDYDDPELTTATFYINDNNGYTMFEDGTKVESKRNRLASFPATERHSGVSHTDAQVRIVLNLNYIA
tara:strand:- start:284 stop:775 length:492 start_codon:yes stop_codon:yes gene_type:complete